jgi:hypothetical protein
MAFPNITDIVATTIQNRSRKIADNVTKNNALLMRLSERGNQRSFGGGNIIMQEISFAENGNTGWYSGYDLLPVAAQDVISAAEFSIKQLACPVVISGLEQLQNAGREQMIDLLEARIAVAEATMANNVAVGLYSDGTGSGGKELTGLDAAVPLDPTTGTYGGIDRATWTFWRSTITDVNTHVLKTNPIRSALNDSWSGLVRGSDRPDLIPMDSVMWGEYVEELQSQQRFTDPATGSLGFPTLKYMDADIVLDGGIGGACPAKTAFMLNTKYIMMRPHRDRDMVPLAPNRRYAINQDAEVQILAWAGNLTTSGAQFQGRIKDLRP